MDDHTIRPALEGDEPSEWDEPRDLIHIDIKKLAGIPPGGGWHTRGERL